MPRRTSIYLTDRAAKILAARGAGDGDGDRSATIRTILARYDEVCRRELPDLSESELSLCRDSLNGVIFDEDNPASVSWVVLNVADSIRAGNLAAKWSVDARKLIAKLNATTYTQRLALVDDAERFWVQQ